MSVPLCKDCKWCYTHSLRWHAKCRHPKQTVFNPVDGERRTMVDCYQERNDGRCGPKGKLFEKKVPLLKRLFGR